MEIMWQFRSGYIIGGLINVFLFCYLMLKIEDKQAFINLYSEKWEEFHNLIDR